jgi:hypothetical protein
MANIPYVTCTGRIEDALAGIKSAQTPERITQDFVKTILKIPGGSGNQIASFLKKIGFVNTDGSPSDLYKKFRNPTTGRQAASEALKLAYAPLYERNEYMHKLSDKDLLGLVVEITGQSNSSSVPGLVVSSINAIKKFAKDGPPQTEEPPSQETPRAIVPISEAPSHQAKRIGMNLSYTINLNLPASSDIAVFNAIFKSLKENLLKELE